MSDAFRRIAGALRAAKASWHGFAPQAGAPDWAEDWAAPGMPAPASMFKPNLDEFDPDTFVQEKLKFSETDSRTVPWLMREIDEGRAVVDRGWIFEARTNASGKMIKDLKEGEKRPYKLRAVKGHVQFEAYRAASKSADKLREDIFGADLNTTAIGGPFDPRQYTEYAPLLGGYFFAQQYLYDMLKGFAYAFEAWNHNPLAHRIIDALAQYTLGRRFTWRVDEKQQDKVDAWERFAEKTQLLQKISKFWIRERLIFGELMLDVKKWRSIHPATVWEIVTDPDDFSDVYYYYRSYPTAYQMFSGYQVPNVPGSKDVKAQKYVVEQLPYSQIIHSKSNCTSFEKRGRSKLFTVLGWLKRVKDIYNNQAIREQMMADYVWDVEIKGGPADVAKYASQYTPLAFPGSTHFHNEAVTRKPMAAAAGATGRGSQSETSNNILSFIATAIGLPKDFFNVISQGGGNRATALVAAEPFTKVIEDEQADWEWLLHKVYEEAMRQAGLEPRYDDIEFTFPSVVKDTTTETVKNIIIGESQGYISKERAATMYTQEMGITADYDFDQEQADIQDEKDQGISGVGMPQATNGMVQGEPEISPIDVPDQPPEAEPGGDETPEDVSPIHGQGKVNTKRGMDKL